MFVRNVDLFELVLVSRM